MSGIVGVVHLDGSPAEGAQISLLAESMRFRGPDGTDARALGPAALGIALLRTTREAARETGLATLDGGVWIAADARIDGRGELVSALTAAGRHVDGSSTDPELILHAYSAWGESLVERLIGDFAFAIWDGPRRRLVCARDHFGMRSLFHARRGSTLVFGNTLGVLLLHPAVSDEVSERSLADFLLFGYNPDPARTVYASVDALPPAHVMTVEDGEVRIRRYWSLPTEGELRYPRVEQYVEHFHEVFGTAVRDRLRTDEAAILLSGGRDSTSVAATVRRLEGEGRETTRLHAHTLVDGGAGEDEEKRYATLAAEWLGIPIHHHPTDGYRAFERMGEPGVSRPQPLAGVLLAIDADLNRAVAAGHRVALTGDGGDPVLRESESWLARLVLAGHPWRALREAAAYTRLHRRLPRPGFRTLARRRAEGPWRSPMPPWIRAEAGRRLGLAARWEALAVPAPASHPTRPEAHGSLASTYWPHWLEQYDAGSTGVPLEYRHPFFDVRVAALALSMPPAQWYNDKGLLRIGMRGLLPPALLARPKTPLARDPLPALLRGAGAPPPAALADEVAALVDRAALPRYAGGTGPDDRSAPALHMRPLILSAWLRARAAKPANG
ncbi:MAG: asnB [Gemmatimonadetes bacterium]|nr:asnB [Gemmatimonadota bacterium]